MRLSPETIQNIFFLYVFTALFLSMNGARILSRESGAGFFESWFRINWRFGLGAGRPGRVLFVWLVVGGVSLFICIAFSTRAAA